MISDQSPRSTSRFLTKFFQILRTDLRLSTAFHPQTNGQNEVTIRMLENFLRPYVELHPHTWSKPLSVEEFAANNTINMSTDYTPFYLNVGEEPALLENLFAPPGSTFNQVVQEAIGRIKEALDDAKLNLVKAQERTKTQVDKIRRDKGWEVGDRVFLSTRHLRTFAVYLPPKLRRRWVGPFTIANVVSPVAFRLDLPPRWQIHPAFHASNLKA